ncbi:YkvI family membrane protein [Corynebacterium sanguinis]|uniref:YkvI family membrane protein n=1 Tax=Corynebacterium TaxID=1716 RepID=UPI0010A9F205|nr:MULTISPECIES: hypothetical protein [Corynebacterium]MCT1463914.1 hypothetical protein [Corynebacterium sanguinis]MCT1555128.1 hypothetical protein [Corynebacterium sanguinis]MCT1584441.1 hypothetical protein [Corynebacterium sanguinis]MCT1613451.1 hypothetical protein [Corynebacterium sanguinis]MCT2023499.1 hypothetical protein [Corynebacterium sanguinis]
MRRAVKVALAFVGLLVGAGFASGQETIQYFLAFGYWGIVGTIVAGLVIVLVGTTLFQLGSYFLADDHSAVFKSVSHPVVARFMDVSTMITLFAIGFVMVAGAGSNLEQQFGFPTWAGAAIMTVALLASGFLDIDRLTNVISSITPFLILAVLGALVVTILNMPDNFSAINELAMQNAPASGVGNNWLLSALNYAAMCTIVAVSMILVIAGSQLNPREAGIGGLIGGIIFSTLQVILAFIIFANIEDVFGADLPLLMVFDNMHPAVGVVVALVIYLMIYNTAVGMFYAMARRMSATNHSRFRPIYFAVVLIGFALSFIGFADLLGWVYPILGYLGMVLIAVMVFVWFRDRTLIKNETQRRERLAALAEKALDPTERDLTDNQRAEVEELAAQSHVEENTLWQSVQEEVAATLDADPASEFSLEETPALDPESKEYEGAPEPTTDAPIDWRAYDEVYKTGSFPAVRPADKAGQGD